MIKRRHLTDIGSLGTTMTFIYTACPGLAPEFYLHAQEYTVTEHYTAHFCGKTSICI